MKALEKVGSGTRWREGAYYAQDQAPGDEEKSLPWERQGWWLNVNHVEKPLQLKPILICQ